MKPPIVPDSIALEEFWRRRLLPRSLADFTGEEEFRRAFGLEGKRQVEQQTQRRQAYDQSDPEHPLPKAERPTHDAEYPAHNNRRPDQYQAGQKLIIKLD